MGFRLAVSFFPYVTRVSLQGRFATMTISSL